MWNLFSFPSDFFRNFSDDFTFVVIFQWGSKHAFQLLLDTVLFIGSKQMFLGLYVFNMLMCFNTSIYVEQKM